MAGSKTLYEILEISPNVGQDEVRAAFRRLARERHPDLLKPALRKDAELEFQKITEAYNTLIDPEKRARYDKSIDSANREAPLNPKDVARALLAKAAEAQRAGEMSRAADYFQQSLAHDSQNPRAHHFYGLFLAQHAGRLADGLRHLEQALRLDGMNVRILLDASKLFAKARMFARAQRLAQTAAELSPGDPGVESWKVQLDSLTQQESR